MSVFNRRRLWSLPVIPTVASLFSCGAAGSAGGMCPQLEGSGAWTLHMVGENADYRVDGQLRFTGRGAFTKLVATTEEGTKEPIEYPVEGVEIRADSVSLTFAPIGYRLEGRCVSPERIQGTFAVPQPPFQDIVGQWTMSLGR